MANNQNDPANRFSQGQSQDFCDGVLIWFGAQNAPIFWGATLTSGTYVHKFVMLKIMEFA